MEPLMGGVHHGTRPVVALPDQKLRKTSLARTRISGCVMHSNLPNSTWHLTGSRKVKYRA